MLFIFIFISQQSACPPNEQSLLAVPLLVSELVKDAEWDMVAFGNNRSRPAALIQVESRHSAHCQHVHHAACNRKLANFFPLRTTRLNQKHEPLKLANWLWGFLGLNRAQNYPYLGQESADPLNLGVSKNFHILRGLSLAMYGLSKIKFLKMLKPFNSASLVSFASSWNAGRFLAILTSLRIVMSMMLRMSVGLCFVLVSHTAVVSSNGSFRTLNAQRTCNRPVLGF